MTYYDKTNPYRINSAMRDLLQEHRVSVKDLIMPLFIHEGIESKKEIKSLPGLYQNSLNDIVDAATSIHNAGIPAVILFGIPKKKDALGSEAYNSEGVIAKAIRLIRNAVPELLVIADCCLCEYTTNSHCGLDSDRDNQHFDQQGTLDALAKAAIAYADAGAHCIAPSGMIDGMVHAIRDGLDSAGHSQTSIMSYSAKYASALYGPFRDAAGSADTGAVDRRHHQMNPSQRTEAHREAEIDENEGADFLIVKPAGSYLDIIRDLAERQSLPIIAYQVSGEYAAIKAAAAQGVYSETEAITESLIAMKRAGATAIISYFAMDFAIKCQ